MKMVGGTGIIGQDMVCGFGNGKYKTFEGTEISIENCVKAKAKDLVVEGKTYQNLLKPINSTDWRGSSAEISDNYIKLIQSGYTEYVKTTCNLLKSNTKYTLIYNVKNHTLSKKTFVLIGATDGSYIVDNNTPLPIDKGINKFTFTSSSTRTNIFNFSLGISSGSLDGEYIELSDIILLEGDCTNVDLPENINGIESVAEKENNILALKVNDVVSSVELPIPLRSLPNGTCDTIEGNKLVQRVGKVVIDGNEDWKLQSCNVKGNGILNIFFIIQDLIIKLKEKQFIICDKYIQQKTPIADTTNEGVLVNEEKRLYLRLFTSKATTVEKAKEYIKSNPFVVYYELAEPIIHDLEIPSISTTKGTNIITTSNNIKPKLKLKVKVKK